MAFSRQEYWGGLDLPDPGMEPVSLMSLALTGGFFTISATWVGHFSFGITGANFPLKDCTVRIDFDTCKRREVVVLSE